MDKAYADAVRLLLAAAPEVFANDIFAMKGGTAVNLFGFPWNRSAGRAVRPDAQDG
jgi:hypothetical protein